MIPVVPHSLAPKESREAETLQDILLLDPIIAALRLSDDEFSDLR